MPKIMIGPVPRANNVVALEVTIENKKVVDARCTGVFFRGFELILRGRDPRDAPYLTLRICGICSSVHGTAAALALEDAAGVRPPKNGNLLRNLIHAADTLQNHIRHFYLFSLPDYVKGPDLGPFRPAYTTGCRLPPKDNDALVQHYFQALEISRLCHELVVLLGGKVPHTHGLLGGGGTVPPAADIIMGFSARLRKINDFIQNVMVPDTYLLAEAYKDYYEIGKRAPALLSYGHFPRGENDRERHFPPGAMVDGRPEKLDASLIREHLRFSWYAGESGLHPARGRTEPDREKEGAYSWVKAPRYNGRAMEGGPLARLWIRGDYRRGISTMDRLVARTLETELIGKLMEEWLGELEPGKPVFTPFNVPREAEGAGLTEAMRGPLGHWLRIEKGRIAHYQIVTPTAWNFSPRDDVGRPGPVEEALLGTPVENEMEPVEVGRVVRAFDVCSTCSTHVIVPGGPAKEMIILP
ncbi:MAG: nickel-dependent hydrogenase large subunit [Armatimonadetes bacterium]|nr:nickel-dependent hydrogenase large subunit [Armatimonadota bacterium]